MISPVSLMIAVGVFIYQSKLVPCVQRTNYLLCIVHVKIKQTDLTQRFGDLGVWTNLTALCIYHMVGLLLTQMNSVLNVWLIPVS